MTLPAIAPPAATAASLGELVRGNLDGLPELLRRHGVLLLVLFGSTAKGTRRPGSDLDLGALFQGPPPGDRWWGQETELELRLEDLLLPACQLNLIALNRAPALLQKEMADHGQALYADHPDRWTLFRIQAYRSWELTEKYHRRAVEDLLRWCGVRRDETDTGG